MSVHEAWRSRHSVRGAMRVDRQGAGLAQAALSDHVVFRNVDDALARQIVGLSWPRTKRVFLHATCLELAPLLSRFSAAESIDLEGAAATLAGQLEPLARVPNVCVSLIGPRLWSPSLGASLEALRPAELALDATTGGGAQWRTPNFTSGIDDADETRRLLNPQRASLRRLSMKTIDSLLEGDWPALETLSLDMAHARLGQMPALTRLSLAGRLVSVEGPLRGLRELEVRGELSVEALVRLAPDHLTELVWSSDGATGLDVLLTRSGASLRRLSLSGPDSVIEAIVRANAPLVALESLAITKPLTETALSWLLENELVGPIKRLRLHSETSDATLARLIDRFGAHLRSLDGVSLGPLSMQALSRRPPPQFTARSSTSESSGGFLNKTASIQRIRHLKLWLREAWAAAEADRRLLSMREVDGGSAILGELEVRIGTWSVAGARLVSGRSIANAAGFLKELQEGTFLDAPYIVDLFMEDGLEAIKKYVEVIEAIRLALISHLSKWPD